MKVFEFGSNHHEAGPFIDGFFCKSGQLAAFELDSSTN